MPPITARRARGRREIALQHGRAQHRARAGHSATTSHVELGIDGRRTSRRTSAFGPWGHRQRRLLRLRRPRRDRRPAHPPSPLRSCRGFRRPRVATRASMPPPTGMPVALNGLRIRRADWRESSSFMPSARRRGLHARSSFASSSPAGGPAAAGSSLRPGDRERGDPPREVGPATPRTGRALAGVHRAGEEVEHAAAQ